MWSLEEKEEVEKNKIIVQIDCECVAFLVLFAIVLFPYIVAGQQLFDGQ